MKKMMRLTLLVGVIALSWFATERPGYAACGPFAPVNECQFCYVVEPGIVLHRYCTWRCIGGQWTMLCTYCGAGCQ
jgi:hypothetical protein